MNSLFFYKGGNLKKIFLFVLFLSFAFSLFSCSNIQETTYKPPFDYLRVFGGILGEESSRIFPLKDGTFYVVATTYSPSLSGDIPKSMNKTNKLEDMLDNGANIWLFQIDPNKPYDEQIIYSRCFGRIGTEELWAACLDENENIIIGAKSTSKEGADNVSTCWIFKVDTKKPYNEQITYSQTFPQSRMWIPLDLKSIDKDTCYLLYNIDKNDGRLNSLMKFDFSKSVEQNPVFDKKIFFSNSGFEMKAWLTFPHISISDNGNINMAWTIEKDKLFSPFDINKPLNINGDVNYDYDYEEANSENVASLHKFDVLVLSLNPNLPEKDWIVYSRIIGGSKSETFPRILKAENESFWINFFTTSDDGDMSCNIMNTVNKIDGLSQKALAIMKINPTLPKDKQIEYSKFLHVEKSIIRFAPFNVYGDKVGFVLDVVTNDDLQERKVDLTEKQKKKNITLPYLDVDEYFARHGILKLLVLDTKNDKYYVHDLKATRGGGLLNPDVVLSETSMFFSIDSCCPPKVGDMPNYKTSIIEEALNNLGSLRHLFTNEKREIMSTFTTDILVGKIDIKNMKEYSDTEKK